MPGIPQRLRPLFPEFFKSLHGRYLLVASFVALFVLVSAWAVQSYVARASQLSTANITERNRVVQHSRLIRDAVWRAEDAMKAYALTPDAGHHETWRTHLRTALARATELRSIGWVDKVGQRAQVNALYAALSELAEQGGKLKQVRDDPQLLFPYMRILTGEMAPGNTAFDTAAQLAMDELGAQPHVDNDAYHRFGESRYLWARMVSEFRILLPGLSGIFGDTQSGVERQTDTVRTYYDQIMNNIDALAARDAQHGLGIQSGRSVREMRQAAQRWYAGYERVRGINAEHWRADAYLMSHTIQPLFDDIWSNLMGLDISVEDSASQDLAVLADVAGHISMALWMLALLVMVFVIGGYLYFDRIVLRPIALVSRALKAEATGKENVELPKFGTIETRDLIDAFVEMRRQVHSRQVALEYQAMHDTLTGLPNRALLQDRLQQGVYAAHREQRSMALVMMDLNRFKEINDTLGHHVGDMILQQVGVRLAEVLRETDTVARLGGDEFALLLPNTTEAQSAQLARKIIRMLEKVFNVSGYQLYVGASLGIALYPLHGTQAQLLLQRADVAMYVAKRSNSGYAVYDAGQDEHSIGRLALVGDLRMALDTGGLEVHYQPQLQISTGKLIAVEALLRWNHPTRGVIPPDEIIPVAEQTGLIKPLTEWVLSTGLRQCALWRRRGIDVRLAVNLSVWNLHDPELDRFIGHLLARWELPASALELEITESAMVADPDMAMLHRLHGMGLRLAVDDYGTGFSSLAYIKALPINALKIDRSFVMDMTEDDNDAVIVRSTIDLAHNLGRKVIAEGVSSKDIWDLLWILRCDIGQGHYISPPLAAQDLEDWVSDRQGGAVNRYHTGA